MVQRSLKLFGSDIFIEDSIIGKITFPKNCLKFYFFKWEFSRQQQHARNTHKASIYYIKKDIFATCTILQCSKRGNIVVIYGERGDQARPKNSTSL